MLLLHILTPLPQVPCSDFKALAPWSEEEKRAFIRLAKWHTSQLALASSMTTPASTEKKTDPKPPLVSSKSKSLVPKIPAANMPKATPSLPVTGTIASRVISNAPKRPPVPRALVLPKTDKPPRSMVSAAIKAQGSSAVNTPMSPAKLTTYASQSSTVSTSSSDEDGLVHDTIALTLKPSKKYAAFISYRWGEGWRNRDRVVEFKDYLDSQGINAWLDSEQMKNGQASRKAIQGMDNSACFIVVLTDEYIHQINSTESTPCQDEFLYWHNVWKRGKDNVVYVVMETKVLNARGAVRMQDYGGEFASKYCGAVYFNIAPEFPSEVRETNLLEIVTIVKGIIAQL